MNTAEELSPDEAYRRIRELAVDAALQFSNGDIARSYLRGVEPALGKVAMRLRDSLVYRYDAVLYHFEQLSRIQDIAAARIQDPRSLRDSGDFLRATIRDQRFFFDDLVFNTIAFLDYFGRFAGVLLQESESLKLRWDKLYKWAKHANAGGKSGNKIHGTAVAERVVHEDEAWIRRLTEYRSNVIHYEAAKPDGRIKFKFTRGEGDSAQTHHVVEAWVPAAFLRALKIEVDKEQVPIVMAASLLMDRLFTTSERLLIVLSEDLAVRVPQLPKGARVKGPIVTRRPSPG